MTITRILIDTYIFSVRRSHALAPILIPAILALEYANVIQRQNAMGKRNTASIPDQAGLRKKASLQGRRLMTELRNVR